MEAYSNFLQPLMETLDSPQMSSSAESWLLLGFSLLASILGSGMIYFDTVWNFITGMNYSILKSNTFLGASLSLSCGTLLMACFNAILTKAVYYILQGKPDKDEKFANLLIIPCLLSGVIICISLNWLVMKSASRSIIPCPHHHHDKPNDAEAQNFHDEGCESEAEDVNGPVGLINPEDNQSSGSIARSQPAPAPDLSHMGHIEEFTRPHGTAEMSKLLVIGIQTTVGIVIHRIPEGLLLFSVSKTDKELGLSLFLALSIHSFSEGFAIATPLYGALQNRPLVMLISILLGCVPPLIGGYIGFLLFNNKTELSPGYTFNFGLYMAGTAGFMLVVCIQMLSAALSYMSERKVMWGVVAGVALTFAGRSL